MLLQLLYCVIIVAAPNEVIVVRRKDAVITDNGQTDASGKLDHVAVQRFSKRVSRIDQQADVMFAAKRFHAGRVHCSQNMDPMGEVDFLQVPLGGIVVTGALFIEHLSRHAALGRSTKQQHH